MKTRLVKSVFYLLRDSIRYSSARCAMHEVIRWMDLKGDLLDIGGGEAASYKKMINCSTYFSINIDPALMPSYVVKEDSANYQEVTQSFDKCIVFNVLKHVYDWKVILQEAVRLLKNGGSIHVIIPFIYPIHECPSDYIRPTSSFIERKLCEAGFDDIDIKPYNIGPCSTCNMFLRKPRLLVLPLSCISIMLDLCLKYILKFDTVKYAEWIPIFYYAKACRR